MGLGSMRNVPVKPFEQGIVAGDAERYACEVLFLTLPGRCPRMLVSGLATSQNT